jgi:hypothetical protein
MNCQLSPLDCVKQPPNQGRSYDLDCLAMFIDSLQMPLSPAHAHGEPLNDSEERGRLLFNSTETKCATCHPAPLYTDLLPHDVGTSTVDERVGPAFDTPTMNGLFNSAPCFHDGSALTYCMCPQSEIGIQPLENKIQDSGRIGETYMGAQGISLKYNNLCFPETEGGLLSCH